MDQSALTGELLPATRKSGDAVFSGSIIRRGEVDALVYATGGKTYFGKTAELVETAVTVSHFQKAVLKIGDYLIVLALIMVAMIVALSIYRGEAILTTLQFALVLTVAAIPVAMPTVLSVTMAVGARKLAKKAGDRQQTGRHRGTGRRRRALRRQDGHADAEQIDARRALLPRQNHARRSDPGRRARLATGERRHDRSGRARRPEGQGRAEALSRSRISRRSIPCTSARRRR